MLRRLYNFTLQMAQHPKALWALAIVAFVESSVFPIPPDVLIIPMIIAAPRRAFLIAGVATIASVAGGLFGYWIGAALYSQIGLPILSFYGMETKFEIFRTNYHEWGAWAVLIAGITPFPYKVITILSGSTGLNLGVFLISSVVARGFRFFIVAALLWRFGSPIQEFIERRLGLLSIVFVALLLGGFLILGLAHE